MAFSRASRYSCHIFNSCLDNIIQMFYHFSSFKNYINNTQMFFYHKTIQTMLNYKDKIQNSVGLSDVFRLHAYLL